MPKSTFVFLYVIRDNCRAVDGAAAAWAPRRDAPESSGGGSADESRGGGQHERDVWDGARRRIHCKLSEAGAVQNGFATLPSAGCSSTTYSTFAMYYCKRLQSFGL